MRVALREIAETILLTLIIFVGVRAVVQNFKVDGASMEPSLHNGQYLIVNKAAYFTLDNEALLDIFPFLPLKPGKAVNPFGEPVPGDIVVFRFPRDPSRDFIKRIIAVPGDVVEIKEGKTYVNGQPLAEPYLGAPPNYTVPAQQVPPGNYFVLGDNRNNSNDSHVWGLVPRRNIVGRAWLVYWPLDSWGIAPNFTLAAPAR